MNEGNQNAFIKKSIYCPELNKIFSSSTDCAKYILENGIWTGIKLKTAKCRISDILNGIFTEYKGLTFNFVEETE